MPPGVLMGRDGTLMAIGANNILGSFRTCEIRVRQDRVDTSGPMDDYQYGRLRRQGASITIDRFVLANALVAPWPASIAGTMMDQVVAPAGWVPGDAIPGAALYSFQCMLPDGSTFACQAHITDIGESLSDDPNAESLTLESYGPITLA